MRINRNLLILLLACPVFAYSQSTLNFPRAFTPADLGSTGFAVVNPGKTSAAVTFTLYSADGSPVGTSPQTIPAAGQLARVGTELFPGVSQPGWVQLTSAASGLQGFWVGGDFATFTDGADAAPTSSDLIFPLVTSNTELNIANTGAASNSVTIRLFGADGELGTAVTRSIGSNAVLQSQAPALFPAANLEEARYIRVTGAPGLSGSAVINGFIVNEWGVTNAVSVADAGMEANFPHVVSGIGGGGNYTTVVGVTNLSSSSQTVGITFNPESGGSPITVNREIPADGSLRDTAQNLFNLPAGFQNGWVRVAGSASLTAFVAYADSVAGGFAIVPVQTVPRTSLMFAHIADLTPWLTGLALLNTTAGNATVNVYAMNPDGTLVGGADNVPTARFTLNAGARTAKLLSELIPQTQQRPDDGGFIFITSTQPLYGIELFFTRNLRVLANVAAGSNATFTAPAAPAPLTLTSISPARAAAGATVTLAGSGFASTAANNTVVFTGASGPVPVAATTATPASLTVTVPNAGITGPVVVQTGGQTSASRILEVLATATSLAPASTVTVDGASTATDVDIYVPPAAGSLNATMIGIGEPGSSISLGTSSVDITAGASARQLVLGGTGMSQANGITVSVSGNGITITGVQFQGTFVFVDITVAASATKGPRNVIVTNSNLDRSVVSGGLFVR